MIFGIKCNQKIIKKIFLYNFSINAVCKLKIEQKYLKSIKLRQICSTLLKRNQENHL